MARIARQPSSTTAPPSFTRLTSSRHSIHTSSWKNLPTTWGGYDKLPLRGKLFSAMGKPTIAMSGKFHTHWGEFGGFKHPDAMRFEAASMIAFGAGCSFGDQLHPSGAMDPETYRGIGIAYKYVKRIEEYGPGGIPFSNLGSMSADKRHTMRASRGCCWKSRSTLKLSGTRRTWSILMPLC